LSNFAIFDAWALLGGGHITPIFQMVGI